VFSSTHSNRFLKVRKATVQSKWHKCPHCQSCNIFHADNTLFHSVLVQPRHLFAISSAVANHPPPPLPYPPSSGLQACAAPFKCNPAAANLFQLSPAAAALLLKKTSCLFASNLFHRRPAAAPLFKKSCFQQPFSKEPCCAAPQPPL
jgi:hypothetical protein